MPVFIKVLTILLYTGAAFMAGMLVSQFSQYALWVMIYTGAAFMAGLWFGQRWERSWTDQQEIMEDPAPSDLGR
jgi:uncharacterized membrane protein YoaK (UPF0700 family)